ncbi:MAG: Zn-ribbon containing protein [Halobacteriales archaeon]
MPHQCTNCQRSFPDGSKQMLSGCPDCGGKKFQFIPSNKADLDDEPAPEPDPSPSSDPKQTAPTPDSFGGWPDESTATASDSPLSPDDDGIIEAPEEPLSDPSPASDPEDLAQADARRTVVDDDELPEQDDSTVVDIPDAEEPSLSDLREELNDQFESIKVLEPGQYELNLMELYDRPEHIIAIEEDGRYVIDVADVGERRE